MKCPECNGTGQVGYAVDISDYCPCPHCYNGEIDEDDNDDGASNMRNYMMIIDESEISPYHEVAKNLEDLSKKSMERLRKMGLM